MLHFSDGTDTGRPVGLTSKKEPPLPAAPSHLRSSSA